MARGIIFDFDGTLYGDWRVWVSIIEDTLSDFKITVTPLDALQKARRIIELDENVNGTLRISGVAAALARERGLDQEEKVRARFFERLDEKMDESGPGEKLVRLLGDFSNRRFRMGIVTFVRKPRITRRLDTWNLRHYFRSVVTPDDVPEFKPSPLPFESAMRDLEVEPGDCFVVGDEPVDMIGGRKAGAKTVGLPQGFFTREELQNAGADHILGSLDLLPSILTK